MDDVYFVIFFFSPLPFRFLSSAGVCFCDYIAVRRMCNALQCNGCDRRVQWGLVRFFLRFSQEFEVDVVDFG